MKSTTKARLLSCSRASGQLDAQVLDAIARVQRGEQVQWSVALISHLNSMARAGLLPGKVQMCVKPAEGNAPAVWRQIA